MTAGQLHLYGEHITYSTYQISKLMGKDPLVLLAGGTLTGLFSWTLPFLQIILILYSGKIIIQLIRSKLSQLWSHFSHTFHKFWSCS